MSEVSADFEAYVIASGPRLKRLAWLLCGDPEQAEDLLQSAYARVLPRWHAVSEYDAPDAYMRKVMVSLRTSWWRRHRNREWITDQVIESSASGGALSASDLDTVSEREALMQALRVLPVRQRTAVVLRHWCDLSEAEVARLMGCSLGAVKSNTSRGLDRLRRELEIPMDLAPTEVAER